MTNPLHFVTVVAVAYFILKRRKQKCQQKKSFLKCLLLPLLFSSSAVCLLSMFGAPAAAAAAAAKLLQSCLTLRDRMDCGLPGSSVHGFSKQEYWSGLPLPSPSELLLAAIWDHDLHVHQHYFQRKQGQQQILTNLL